MKGRKGLYTHSTPRGCFENVDSESGRIVALLQELGGFDQSARKIWEDLTREHRSEGLRVSMNIITCTM